MKFEMFFLFSVLKIRLVKDVEYIKLGGQYGWIFWVLNDEI